MWRELETPYESARARVLAGRACRALGDEEAFALELEAARAAFEQLGAATDISLLDVLDGAVAAPHGLSARELEVLRLLARGKSNRASTRSRATCRTSSGSSAWAPVPPPALSPSSTA
jgi:hypothetical protein